MYYYFILIVYNHTYCLIYVCIPCIEKHYEVPDAQALALVGGGVMRTVLGHPV